MEIKKSFVIPKDVFKKCSDFAIASVDSSKDCYARRNQRNVDKIKDDIRNGKIGEEMAWRAISNILPDLKNPDYNIYEDKRDKSWTPDLIDASGISLACKCASEKSASLYGLSWVFQFNNNKSFDCDKTIFKTEDDKHFACFVLIDPVKMVGEIKAIVKVSWLHKQDLFKPMKLAHLQSKRAVYYSDLEQFEEQLLWQI